MLSPEWSNSELIIPSDDNRSRILDAVIETIDDAGAEAVRITMIAEAAGVSGPLVYHYFRDRRHLVATAMIERAQRAFTGRMERLTQSLAVVESTDGLIELFAELDANGLGAARQRARWDEIEARSIARHDPELLRTLADSEERMIGSLVEFFDSIRYRGWLRSDFDLRALAVLFRGISFGQVFQELDANLDAPTGEWSRVVANAFLGFFTVDVVPKVDRVWSPFEPAEFPRSFEGSPCRARPQKASQWMEILDAAIVEIDNVGPAALRIKRVAEHADVSPALIFHHFQTRDGLIGEAMRRRFQKMAASRSIDKLHEFEKAVEKYDLMEALTSVGARSIFHTPSDIRWGWLEAIAEARTNVIVREVVEEAYTLIGEVIADLLNTGTRDGAISPLVDPRILSSIWNSAAFGITISEVATSGGVSFEDWANVLRISFATLLGVEDGVRA